MDTFWSDTLKLSVPIIAVVVAWAVNEHSKRKWEEYTRKEANYKALLEALKGFYVETANREQKEAFLDQLKLCWLYCPDEVIRKAYAFLATVYTDARTTDAEKELALGELVLAVRKDLLSRKTVRETSLTAADFKHFRAT
jgi:Pyruvate/2-oxoacid:ferredoxin oxidoreductase delta subunit